MKAKKTKIETDADAFAAADEIVSLNNSQTAMNAEMEAELKAVRAKYAPALDKLKDSIKQSTEALRNYCGKKAVQARLFKPGSRFAVCEVA